MNMYKGVLSGDKRFWAKVDKTHSCWLWRGGVGTSGYGTVKRKRLHKYMLLTHRLSYAHAKGPIPAGLQIDHLCRVPICVNPDHLEAVTARVNQSRRPGWSLDQCPSGHPRTPENTYHRHSRNGKPTCAECARIRARAYRARKRSERASS